MKNNELKSKTNENLIHEIKAVIDRERHATAALLDYLKEVDRRKLHLQMGYSSLFDFLTRHFHYEESAASRRISAMRLMRDVPEVEVALTQGSLSLSNAATVQRFFRAEEKRGVEYTIETKHKLVMQMQNTSRNDCERRLLALIPDVVAIQRQERTRAVSATQTEVKFIASDALMQKLDRLKNLLAHTQDGSLATLVETLADWHSSTKTHYKRKRHLVIIEI